MLDASRESTFHTIKRWKQFLESSKLLTASNNIPHLIVINKVEPHRNYSEYVLSEIKRVVGNDNVDGDDKYYTTSLIDDGTSSITTTTTTTGVKENRFLSKIYEVVEDSLFEQGYKISFNLKWPLSFRKMDKFSRTLSILLRACISNYIAYYYEKKEKEEEEEEDGEEDERGYIAIYN
eukprot:TRINITY_DN371_c0_g2_i5.p1 TRINITY_DN371_c0_g2~~TRINITY_DN371_c0_g2_i5.p1  ORF type:complete len:178 (-),score=44.02 TRINITY_DN371_c0_g2_i5:3-536(-)